MDITHNSAGYSILGKNNGAYGKGYLKKGIPKWNIKPHPMLGKKRLPVTEVTRKKISIASILSQSLKTTEEKVEIARKAEATKLLKYGTYMCNMKNIRCGKREDLGDLFFRSSWEANYARYLNYLISQNIVQFWEFEKEQFIFSELCSPKSYLPDFKVLYVDGHIEYHEVKGRFDDRSRLQIERFNIHFLKLLLKVIDSRCYQLLYKMYYTKIANWETYK